MNNTIIKSEPYRLFFPTGIFYLAWGALVWIPLIWSGDNYPVLLHRYLMLNGFTASFIAGFLMTALPRFSKTKTANTWEITLFYLVTLAGLIFAWLNQENLVFICSSLQPLIILAFMLSRFSKRKENPPYSFVFIFVGLILWIVSALGSIFIDPEIFKGLHYEGAIASIILGVGSRLIPGILGHVEIVSAQKKEYETLKPLIKTVPPIFIALIASFVGSYFLKDQIGFIIRSFVVSIIALNYWKVLSAPKEKTALTWSIWISCWFILASFVMKAIWIEGNIHASHSFFISGIVLLTLLIATRVIQSHGPKDKNLENSKVIYFVTLLLIMTTATRVSAFVLPELYLRLLGFSSLLLVCAIIHWSLKYLKYSLSNLQEIPS